MNLATIERIRDIFPHPNADQLEFARVKNFTCLVRKDQFRVGDWCILIKPDSVLPDAEWASPYKKHSPNRVKAQKFRGMWSFGIVESMGSVLPEDYSVFHNHGLLEGVDLTEVLGITKYEEPEPVEPGAESGFPHFLRKTGEDLYQSIPVQEYLGQLVDVTLKEDGKSATRFHKEDVVRNCGRRLVFDPASESIYNKTLNKYAHLFKDVMDCSEGMNLAFRGEIVGEGASTGKKNPRTGTPTEFLLFGVYDCDTMENFGPASPYYFEKIGKVFEIPTVRVIEKQVPLTMELIEKYRDMETLDGKYFEGVVINGDGFSFKVINLNYDSKK